MIGVKPIAATPLPGEASIPCRPPSVLLVPAAMPHWRLRRSSRTRRKDVGDVVRRKTFRPFNDETLEFFSKFPTRAKKCETIQLANVLCQVLLKLHHTTELNQNRSTLCTKT